MEKWEYKVLDSFSIHPPSTLENVLNQWGQQGWELVCWTTLYSSSVILKRKVQS